MNRNLATFARNLFLLCATAFTSVPALGQPYPPDPIVKDGIAVLLRDYASVPLSGRGGSITSFGANVNTNDQLSRVNFLRSEPTNAPLTDSRFFICDLNRNLYVFTKSNKTFTSYINFQAVFKKLDNAQNFAGGLVTFAFDPGYATNGIFYTVHTEDPTFSGSAFPSNTNFPGLKTNGYTLTGVINPPVGSVQRQAVLIEWADTNINNNTFEGTAREVLRLGFTTRIHPLGDLIFNPLAQPGDEDYRNLYLAVGDGGAGENVTNDTRHYIPQRLDALQGKTLRITPDLNLRTGTSIVSTNGRYRIPSSGADPNPFVGTNGARGEIFTYGHRNPHRFSWDPVSGRLLVFEIGLYSFEEVNIIHKGENYGYSECEGTKRLVPTGIDNGPGSGLITDVPPPATIPMRINDTPTATMVPVHYPVAEYFQTEGDSMACGFVYRGALMPSLYGKCIFGDITTARLFYCDYAEMLAGDDNDPTTIATVHELQVVFNSPTNPTNQPPVAWRMFDVVSEAYHLKGGKSSIVLPGAATDTGGLDPDGIPYGGGRADIRLAQGSDGELYLLSKSDGMIRQFAAVVPPPAIQSITATSNDVTLSWQSIGGMSYRVQYNESLGNTNWQNVPGGDVIATNSTSWKTDAFGSTNRFYRVRVLP